jgi:hypothetical protein
MPGLAAGRPAMSSASLAKTVRDDCVALPVGPVTGRRRDGRD